MSEYITKWHREIEIFSRIKPLVVIEGNVLDSYQYPTDGSTPKGSILRLNEYLHFFYKDMGYESIVFYDSLRGFYNGTEKGYIERFASLTEEGVDNGFIRAEFKGAARQGSAVNLIRRATTQAEVPSVVVMDYASRYIISPDSLAQCEVDSFTVLMQAALEARDVRRESGILKNLIVLVVSKANDLPAWFYLNNPSVKIVNLSFPTKEEREALVKSDNFRGFFAADIYREDKCYYEEHPEELIKLQDKFIAMTDGFSFTEMNGLRRLAKNERVRISGLCDVVDLYKYGVKDNPWKNLDYDKIRNGKEAFERRVKGQSYAVAKTLDIVKRAITGLSGLQGTSLTRPKGVLFFAGPTGTGKTETAKTLAELIFGDDRSCVRFDMSEYAERHSDQKLIGAPPGYVGYEAGGQLTNAIKKNPFCILLFDEIEKAHPSILDKFLQILEDGRMTDGQGNTVYFTETIIVFTSNLGTVTEDENGQMHDNVNLNMDYLALSQKIRTAVERYFKFELGRPEILNRIGDNVVVFDYIREDTAKEILRLKLQKLSAALSVDKRVEVVVSVEALAELEAIVLSNLADGGRGIGNVIEALVLNPLSRYIFDQRIESDVRIYLDAVYPDTLPPSVGCRTEKL